MFKNSYDRKFFNFHGQSRSLLNCMPCVLKTCSCGMPCVLICSNVNVLCVLTCAHVPTCLACLRVCTCQCTSFDATIFCFVAVVPEIVHQLNVWNLLKVNNKDIRSTSLTSFWCPNYYLQIHFTSCSSIFSAFIVSFEQVTGNFYYRSHSSIKLWYSSFVVCKKT